MNPREEIKDIAPKLSQWKHPEGYTLPADYFVDLSDNVLLRAKEIENLEPYFNSLSDQVMNKIKEEEKGKVIPIRSYLKYVVAAAMLITVGTLLWSNQAKESTMPTYAMLETSEELDFIIDEIAMEDIFDSEFIDDESLDEILVYDLELIAVDDFAEEILYNASDDILEEFL